MGFEGATAEPHHKLVTSHKDLSGYQRNFRYGKHKDSGVEISLTCLKREEAATMFEVRVAGKEVKRVHQAQHEAPET